MGVLIWQEPSGLHHRIRLTWFVARDNTLYYYRLMSRLSFRAWRGDHYFGLAELLSALGGLTAEAWWELRLDEVAPGPQGTELESLAQKSRVGTRELILASFPDGQIIDGELRGYADSGATEPIITIYAVDSSDWDVECADEKVYAAVKTAYPEAAEVS